MHLPRVTGAVCMTMVSDDLVAVRVGRCLVHVVRGTSLLSMSCRFPSDPVALAAVDMPAIREGCADQTQHVLLAATRDGGVWALRLPLSSSSASSGAAPMLTVPQSCCVARQPGVSGIRGFLLGKMDRLTLVVRSDLRPTAALGIPLSSEHGKRGMELWTGDAPPVTTWEAESLEGTRSTCVVALCAARVGDASRKSGSGGARLISPELCSAVFGTACASQRQVVLVQGDADGAVRWAVLGGAAADPRITALAESGTVSTQVANDAGVLVSLGEPVRSIDVVCSSAAPNPAHVLVVVGEFGRVAVLCLEPPAEPYLLGARRRALTRFLRLGPTPVARAMVVPAEWHPVLSSSSSSVTTTSPTSSSFSPAILPPRVVVLHSTPRGRCIITSLPLADTGRRRGEQEDVVASAPQTRIQLRLAGRVRSAAFTGRSLVVTLTTPAGRTQLQRIGTRGEVSRGSRQLKANLTSSRARAAAARKQRLPGLVKNLLRTVADLSARELAVESQSGAVDTALRETNAAMHLCARVKRLGAANALNFDCAPIVAPSLPASGVVFSSSSATRQQPPRFGLDGPGVGLAATASTHTSAVRISVGRRPACGGSFCTWRILVRSTLELPGGKLSAASRQVMSRSVSLPVQQPRSGGSGSGGPGSSSSSSSSAGNGAADTSVMPWTWLCPVPAPLQRDGRGATRVVVHVDLCLSHPGAGRDTNAWVPAAAAREKDDLDDAAAQAAKSASANSGQHASVRGKDHDCINIALGRYCFDALDFSLSSTTALASKQHTSSWRRPSGGIDNTCPAALVMHVARRRSCRGRSLGPGRLPRRPHLQHGRGGHTCMRDTNLLVLAGTFARCWLGCTPAELLRLAASSSSSSVTARDGPHPPADAAAAAATSRLCMLSGADATVSIVADPHGSGRQALALRLSMMSSGVDGAERCHDQVPATVELRISIAAARAAILRRLLRVSREKKARGETAASAEAEERAQQLSCVRSCVVALAGAAQRLSRDFAAAQDEFYNLIEIYKTLPRCGGDNPVGTLPSPGFTTRAGPRLIGSNAVDGNRCVDVNLRAPLLFARLRGLHERMRAERDAC